MGRGNGETIVIAPLGPILKVHLTLLSHIQRYQDEGYLNTHLLRWQPETIVNLPEGIGFIPFHVPGSPELMAATVERLRTYLTSLPTYERVLANRFPGLPVLWTLAIPPASLTNYGDSFTGCGLL
jgi:hypothetical protein